MSAETTAPVIPDVRPGDRITVPAGTQCVPRNCKTTSPCTIEVTYVRTDDPRGLTVSGLVLTKLGNYSAAGALEGRNVRAFIVAGAAGPDAAWDWYGEPPATRTREALVTEAVETYGVDRRDAVAVVAMAGADLIDAQAGAYGTRGNVPGWSGTRNQPTAAGAEVIRNALAVKFARHVQRAASSAVRLGAPRTIDPAGRLVFTDGHGRGWVLVLRSRDLAENLTANVIGSIPPGKTAMRSLMSEVWAEGVPALAGDAAIARRHLLDVAEPATVDLPGVGPVPALGAYLRPVALACATAPAGRWLVVVWPADVAPFVLGDTDEPTTARSGANQAVSVHGTTRVYLARRHRYGTTVYARSGESAAFGTLPAEVPAADPAHPGVGAAWAHVVRGEGSSDPAQHAVNVRESIRLTLGLPAGATPEQIDQAAGAQVAEGDQPFAAYLQAFVHVVGDPVGNR